MENAMENEMILSEMESGQIGADGCYSSPGMEFRLLGFERQLHK